MKLQKAALRYHAKHQGKLATKVLTPIRNARDLALAYTPGVAEASRAIAADKRKVYDYTLKGHTVAIISDGSAVLGLGNIGPEAALPVMEGKAALFKTFAGLDAFPLCLATQNVEEIVAVVKAVAPVFGAINLEDISAPRCFAVEAALQDLGIPVMHDDQHGTATVVLAGLINAARVAGKSLADLTVVISGAGAAGQAITKILTPQVKNILVLDSKGLVAKTRRDLDEYKRALAEITNKNDWTGDLRVALKDADVFIGVSKAGLLQRGDIALMADKPIIFAMANPTPEIMPDEAVKGGAYIVATGRSDFPNQVNNSLAFPGIFKGALEAKATGITQDMKLAAAAAIAGLVKKPTRDKIIPGPFAKGLVKAVSQAVRDAA
jgi:malate dehydrogenase (oxaloacetate-decarboxylating)